MLEEELQQEANDRARLAGLREDIRIAELRLGLRKPETSVRYKWRKALMRVRTSMVLGVEERLFDHLRACHPVDLCRSIPEEAAYLTAYFTQLNAELSRREEVFNEKVAVWRRMGHTATDS